MITQQNFIQHYNSLYENKAVYVWGANGEEITKELTDRLYLDFGSATYNKAYYDNKYAEGKGRIGADCSGSIYPLSKADNTARGYYQACPKKGSISALPKGTACLIFNASFTHVGAYLGNGTTIEMKSSKENCVKQAFNASRWAYYGIPSWLSTDGGKENLPVSTSVAIIKNVQKWCNKNYNTSLTVDGEYGPKTKKALCKALQKCLNKNFGAKLTVDGVFGQETKAACVNAKKHKDLTYIAQALLYTKGYSMSHSIKNNDFDGEYGTGMERTITIFQSDTKGLRQDGKCKGATFKKLFA